MSNYTIAQLVQMRMQIAATIAEKTKEMKASIESEKKKLDAVEVACLSKLIEMDVENVKTEFGTVSKDKKESFTVEDKTMLMDWVKETGEWEILDNRVNAPNTRTFLSEHNGELPPGIKYSAFVKTRFRKPTKKI